MTWPAEGDKSLSIRWEPFDGTGLEQLTLSLENGRIAARSVLRGTRDGKSYDARYTVACDEDWTVRELALESAAGDVLALTRNGNGLWHDGGGRYLPAFDGCIDIDLGYTPFTNSLPIRRLDLRESDGPADIRVLYIAFGSFTPEIDEQRYTCLDYLKRYRFQSRLTDFTADIDVDGDGLVTEYPGLFRRIANSE